MRITLEIKCPTCLSDSIKKNGIKVDRLIALARKWKTTIYQLKQGLLSSYMREQLRKPEIVMLFSGL